MIDQFVTSFFSPATHPNDRAVGRQRSRESAARYWSPDRCFALSDQDVMGQDEQER